MGSKDYNRLFSEADDLAEARAGQLGRPRLPADERAAVDEIYLKWLGEERFDELVSALEGMFNAIGILSYRLELLIDLAGELEDRGDFDRIKSLFERTVPAIWRAYVRELRHAKEGQLGNVAEAATRRSELLTMLYDYFEAAHRLGDPQLAARIKTEALSFANEGRFHPKMNEWRSPALKKRRKPNQPAQPTPLKRRG